MLDLGHAPLSMGPHLWRCHGQQCVVGVRSTLSVKEWRFPDGAAPSSNVITSVMLLFRNWVAFVSESSRSTVAWGVRA